MVFTEATMATATGTAGLYGLILKIRALKSDKTHAFQQVGICHAEKKYNINFSGAPLSLWNWQETSMSSMSLSRATQTTTLIIIVTTPSRILTLAIIQNLIALLKRVCGGSR